MSDVPSRHRVLLATPAAHEKGLGGRKKPCLRGLSSVLTPGVQNVTLLRDGPFKRELRLTEVTRMVPNQLKGVLIRGDQGPHRGKTL